MSDTGQRLEAVVADSSAARMMYARMGMRPATAEAAPAGSRRVTMQEALGDLSSRLAGMAKQMRILGVERTAADLERFADEIAELARRPPEHGET
jgi:hypothetical protein